MADFKQFEINGVPFNSKDDVAREGLTDLIDILSEVKHAGAYVADGGAKLSLSIPLTETESTSVATAFSAIVPEFEGVTELKSGMMVCIKNTKVTSAAASATPKCWTLNIKKSAEDTGFGAKPVYVTTAAATYSTTHFTKDYKMLFIYDEDLNSGNGGWYIGQIFNSNTTYTNAALGQGYGTCTTAAATAAKVVTLSSYALTVNGTVAVKFSNDVPANATMNINSKGAKAIYEGDAPITAGVIKAGDIAVFIYNTYYRLIGINRVGGGVQADWNETNTGSAAYIQNKPSIPTDSNLVHKTGDETISGDKTFTGTITSEYVYGSFEGWAELSGGGVLPNTEFRIASPPSELEAKLIVGYSENGEGFGGWTQIYNEATDKTLQDELDARNNVQADWNQTTTTADDYIKNKPTIPNDSTLVHKSGNESIGGQKTFSSKIVANGGIDVGQGTVSSEDSQDFSYITTGGGDTLQDALDAKEDKTLIVTVTKSGDTYTADKTYAEVKTAVTTGTNVIVKYYDMRFDLLFTTTAYSDYLDCVRFQNVDYFERGGINQNYIREFIVDTSGWEYYEHDNTYYAPINSPALTGTPTAPTAAAGTNTTQIATTAFVTTAINSLPDPMVFKGSLGTGGTITTLPAASNDNKGFTYKVITAGTYASQAAKVGDTFISDGSTWVLIPSGDEPSGTVTSITLNATAPLTINDSTAITTSGTRTLGITMDSTPTANSSNPVTSGALKTALDAKANDINVVHKGTASSSQAESIYGVKTFESELHAYGGIDVYQGEITSTAAQDFSYITTNGGDTLQEALDSKANAIPIIDLT